MLNEVRLICSFLDKTRKAAVIKADSTACNVHFVLIYRAVNQSIRQLVNRSINRYYVLQVVPYKTDTNCVSDTGCTVPDSNQVRSNDSIYVTGKYNIYQKVFIDNDIRHLLIANLRIIC